MGGKRLSLFGDSLEVVFLCPNHECDELFIAYYEFRSWSGEYVLVDLRPREIQNLAFSPSLQELSKEYCEIFEEAHKAEQLGLKKVCGVGYRKALEFLIKDYLIAQEPENREAIESDPLGACIERRVSDPRVKEIARRAVWLGNDETHYKRTWIDKDIDDLKSLIRLTVHWIEAELLTNETLQSMPRK